VILRVFQKNPRLSLRGGQAVLRKKSLNISYDTIRRRLWSKISKHSEEIVNHPKEIVKKTRKKRFT